MGTESWLNFRLHATTPLPVACCQITLGLLLLSYRHHPAQPLPLLNVSRSPSLPHVSSFQARIMSWNVTVVLPVHWNNDARLLSQLIALLLGQKLVFLCLLAFHLSLSYKKFEKQYTVLTCPSSSCPQSSTRPQKVVKTRILTINYEEHKYRSYSDFTNFCMHFLNVYFYENVSHVVLSNHHHDQNKVVPLPLIRFLR